MTTEDGPGFTDQSVTFTSDELTTLSDVLRRVESGGFFTGRPEFATAAAKIENAKMRSYPGSWRWGEAEEAEVFAWFREQYPQRWPSGEELRELSAEMRAQREAES